MENALKNALEKEFGPNVKITLKNSVYGGDISASSLLTLNNGEKIFIKENSVQFKPIFAAEAEGLMELAAVLCQSEYLFVPRVIAHGCGKEKSFLMLQNIDKGDVQSGANFGHALAELHRKGRQDACGFDTDNWIGSTPQENTWTENWHDFFADKRLGFQWTLARRNGYGDSNSDAQMESLQKKLPDILPDLDAKRSSLLHGDLWGGNWMADSDSCVWIFDPAVYYGHREADIAMTGLFGGFPSGFHAAYQEAWPLEAGFKNRQEIYNLYHLLNHLNLFGPSYWAGVKNVINQFA